MYLVSVLSNLPLAIELPFRWSEKTAGKSCAFPRHQIELYGPEYVQLKSLPRNRKHARSSRARRQSRNQLLQVPRTEYTDKAWMTVNQASSVPNRHRELGLRCNGIVALTPIRYRNVRNSNPDFGSRIWLVLQSPPPRFQVPDQNSTLQHHGMPPLQV